MRCPKCGFISFDHYTSCAKCGKDIAEVASELQGTSIKVETPMFLGAALAAYADRQESFEEQDMVAEAEEGIDFTMEDEAVEMAGSEEAVDFSMTAEEQQTDISLAEAEAEEAAGAREETEETAGAASDVEAEEGAAPQVVEKTFEELDLMGAAADEEEGGLEFDLEDFLDDMDEEKPKSSG